MTRAELVAGLRERFARLRPAFPDVIERMRRLSSERLLESYCRCTGCGGMHFTPAELVALAAKFDDVDAFMAHTEELALQRVPKRCLDATDRREAEILRSRN